MVKIKDTINSKRIRKNRININYRLIRKSFRTYRCTDHVNWVDRYASHSFEILSVLSLKAKLKT